MRSKLLFMIVLFISVSVFSQEVIIEDTTREKNYMDHPDYGKNKNRYYELSREIDLEFSNQQVYYIKNLRNPAFRYDNNGYSKEKLLRFISQAEEHKNNLRRNTKINNLCSEYVLLKPKVIPGSENKCELWLNNNLISINSSIKRAKDLLKDIKSKR